MSGKKPHPLENSQSPLMRELNEGSASLPVRTVMTLVLSGLWVRMSRSLITMVAIILAVAFLAYMGAISNLTLNLAQTARDFERAPRTEPTEIRAALDQVGTPGALWDAQEARQAAQALGLDRAGLMETEAAELEERIETTLTPEFEAADQQLNRLEERPDADPAHLGLVRNWRNETAQRLEEARENLVRLQARITLAQELATATGDLTDEQQILLEQAMVERQRELLLRFRNPERFRAEELPMATLLLEQLQTVDGMRGPAETLQAVLVEEERNRTTTELVRLLRRAGVNIDDTLRGDQADRWLIVMAVLLCTVGIANAMLMSVTERFREIGTMKCLGAVDSLVVKLFLLESGMLGLVGALLGFVLGLLVAMTGGLLQFAGFAIVYFPYSQIGTVFAWSFLTGIVLAVVGTLYPAILAARMNPVDALRVEE